jgi:NAD(P)-dependent dehydrogenase (short-subunit alcohol dehydrogenase family)
MPPRTVAEKRVLVTGAASGIGRACAIASARRGARLCITDIAEEPLRETAAEISASGGTVEWARTVDVSDHDSVARMAAEIHAGCGSVDIAVNVAGIAVWGTVERLSHEQWRRVVDVNLMGPIHVVECFLPEMIAAGRGGHLVNVSSAAGLFGLPWHAPYSAAKFGLRGLSEVLRFDLRRHDIGVSLVCPGAVDTGLVTGVEIAGIDTTSETMRRAAERFRRHAATPEQAAAKILEGIERNRFWVYTSRDTQFQHFMQRHFEFLYVMTMRFASDRFERIMSRAAAEQRAAGR